MKTKKRHRIKSRTRFITAVFLLMLLAVTGINGLLGTMDARGETEPTYVTVTVAAGDTIWEIADKYLGDRMDVREAVHRIAALNDITAETLQPGQTLKIPV